jgi:hypothetical protein
LDDRIYADESPSRPGGFLRRRGCIALLLLFLVLIMFCCMLVVALAGLYYVSPGFQQLISGLFGAA